MKLKPAFIMLLFILCFFIKMEAQSNLKISGVYEDKTIAWVLRDLDQKYKISFAFDSQELNKKSGNWKFENMLLDKALKELFEGSGYSYMWSDATCVVFPITESERVLINDKSEPENVVVRGEVRDVVSSELLPFAAVASLMTGISTQTDPDGKFQIELPLQKGDSLIVFFVGYEPQRIPLDGTSEFILIRLVATRTYLPDVLIQAENSGAFVVSTNPSAQVINPNSTGALFGTGEADIFRLAQVVPGISGTLESNNGLVIRGSNSDQTMINLDGFNIYHQDHMFGTFSAVNANAVKSIRVLKGSLPASVGGRTGGLLEMIGREGSLKRTKATIDLSTLSIGAVVESPLDSIGHGAVIITARKSYTNLVATPVYEELFSTIYNTSLVTGGNEQSPFRGGNEPDFNFQDANVKFTWRPNTADALNLSLYHSLDHLFIQYADTFSNELENVRDVFYSDESTKRNLGASVRWNRIWNEKWTSQFLLASSRFTGSFFSGDTIREILFQTDSLRFSSEENVLRDVNSRLEIHRKHSTGEWNSGVEFNLVEINRKLNQQGEISNPADAESNTWAFYVQNEFRYRKRLKLLPGFRLPYYVPLSTFYPEWRFTASYDAIRDKLQLKLFAGNSHQFIQRTQVQNLYLNTPDYWEVAGNNALPVISAYQSMAGFTWTGLLNLDAEFWYKRSEGAILNVNQAQIVSDLLATRNYAGQSEAYGLDFSCRKDYKRHHFLLNYSWLKAAVKVPELEAEIVPELFDQRHEVKCLYEVKWKKWSLAGLWVWGSGRPFTPYLGAYVFQLPDNSAKFVPLYGQLNTARLPQYARLDASASYIFRIGNNMAKISVSVYNVLNRRNVRDIQYLFKPFYSDNGVVSYSFEERKIPMIGILPSLNFSLSF